MKRELVRPAAILLGGALVAVAAFALIRSARDGPRDLAPAPTASLSLSPEELTARVTSDATAALERLRPQLVEDCWEPSVRKARRPATVPYSLDLTFDPFGQQIAIGISEDREAFRADVAECLRGQSISLRVRAPGVSTRVSVSFTLP